MGYDRGDRFPFTFEPNGIPFGSKLKEKLSPRSYPIQFERKWKQFSQCREKERKTTLTVFGESDDLQYSADA